MKLLEEPWECAQIVETEDWDGGGDREDQRKERNQNEGNHPVVMS